MENNRIETAKMMMSFYNSLAGTSCRIGDNQRKADIICEAIDRGDITDLKNHIRRWVQNHSDDARQSAMTCFEMYTGKQEVPSNQVTETQVGSSLGILEQAVAQIIAKTQAEKIENEIMGNVQQTIQDFIKSEYGTIERKVVTVIDGVPKPQEGIIHEKFDTILKFVANNEPVYLSGPAGSGKNVICKQIADALGIDFYFTNAVTQEYQLKGFTDAMGNFHETQFYKAFKNGGVFMLDEMDASIPEVLVILNAAIANRYFDFPAPIGYVEAHPDFRVIAAGNTTGHGADFEYVGRNQLDGASLDRFAIVKVGYSKTIEDSVAGDIELADFCRAYRNAAKKAGIQVIVSYRAIGRLAKMLHLLSVDEALDTCLVKGLDKDDIHLIRDGINMNNKYTQALDRLAA